jgi:hypothetical protein
MPSTMTEKSLKQQVLSSNTIIIELRADVETWSKHVIPGGILALHDVDVWPGVSQMVRELLAENSTWKQLARVRSLTLLQRAS